MTEYNNPMRFSLRTQSIDLSQYPFRVTEMTIRPGEGNVYVHWEADDGE